MILVLTELDYANATLAVTSSYLLNRLQLVLNAATHLLHQSRRSDHITPLLTVVNLHWLSMPEHIKYKLALLAYRCLHGIGSAYLKIALHHAAYLDGRQHLRSASTAAVLVPRTRLSSIDYRPFPVAAARVCHWPFNFHHHWTLLRST